MELLLNACWLVLAIAAFLLRLSRSRPGVGPSLSRKPRLESLALGCALAILFPSISASDDLQIQPAVLETASLAQLATKSGDDRSGSPASCGDNLQAELPVSPDATWAEDGVSGWVWSPRTVTLSTDHSRGTWFRAPPPSSTLL